MYQHEIHIFPHNGLRATVTVSNILNIGSFQHNDILRPLLLKVTGLIVFTAHGHIIRYIALVVARAHVEARWWEYVTEPAVHEGRYSEPGEEGHLIDVGRGNGHRPAS